VHRRQRRRRVVRRRKHDRTVGREDVGNPLGLGYRSSRDLQRRRSEDDVAIAGRRADCLELVRDEVLHRAPSATWRRRRPHFGTDGRDGKPKALDPLSKIRGHAEARVVTERLQLQPERHQRLDVAARSDGREEGTHYASTRFSVSMNRR